MDRLLREGNPPAGQLASPKPQYKKPGVDEYAPVEGQHGAPFATLKDASGNVVSPATDAKLEQVKSELELVKSELQTIKANQLSGDQKVQLSGTIVEIYNVPEPVTIPALSRRQFVFTLPENIVRWSFLAGHTNWSEGLYTLDFDGLRGSSTTSTPALATTAELEAVGGRFVKARVSPKGYSNPYSIWAVMDVPVFIPGDTMTLHVYNTSETTEGWMAPRVIGVTA